MIAGEGPAPSLVISLVQRLPDTSMTTAIASGGRDHFGWGVDRYLAAETFDALNQNTRATGNWKGKPPAFPEWPRPGKSNSTGRDKKRTVADVFRMFPRRAG